MKAANRVFLNTIVLYGRMLISMAIALYSTRLVLNALGSTDYGIFNLIAGVVAMLSFLNTAMATSTQRFLSYHQGKEDLAMQKKVFTNSLALHICIGLIVVAGLEIAGFFLFDGFLNIPAERIPEARIIFHFMGLTVFFTIIAVPFSASLTAHENLVWVAVVNLTETFLKLFIAIALYVLMGDKLVIYGLLTAAISIVSFCMYAFFTLRKYPEVSIRGVRNVERPLLKELTSFAGWNLFGSLCTLGRTQGLAVILNLFFGAAINAAYGIANQVNAQLLFFSSTMLRAVNPQLMKSEGANDRKRMLRLAMMASKFGFFMLAFFAIPIIFEMPAILGLWLKNVPENTVIFCSLILVATLCNQLTIGLQSALQATGKIKYYQIGVGGLVLMNLPIAYILLKSWFPAYVVLISYAFVELLACSLRLFFAKKLAGLSIRMYFQRVFSREVLPVVLSAATCYVITSLFTFDFRFILTGITSAFVFSLSIFLFGLCDDEKDIFRRLFDNILSKIKKKKTIVYER